MGCTCIHDTGWHTPAGCAIPSCRCTHPDATVAELTETIAALREQVRRLRAPALSNTVADALPLVCDHAGCARIHGHRGEHQGNLHGIRAGEPS